WGPHCYLKPRFFLSPHLHFSCHLLSSVTNPTMLLLLSFLYPMLSVRVVSAACYDFNFNLNTHPDAQPYNNIVGRISMCCDTNRSTSDLPYTPDTCLPSGLCKNTAVARPRKSFGSATSSSASVTGSKTITSTSSMTSTSTSSPASTVPPSSISTGAKAGIGIGSVALAVLVVGAILAIATGHWYQDESKIELQSIPQYQHRLYEMRGDPRSPGTHGELGVTLKL
ncbi:hypothetical protein BGZ57DRAFT_996774, partial [Hyaloscypha finlandica]